MASWDAWDADALALEPVKERLIQVQHDHNGDGHICGKNTGCVKEENEEKRNEKVVLVNARIENEIAKEAQKTATQRVPGGERTPQ